MKKTAFISAVVILISVSTAAAATAQQWRGWRGSGGWGPGTPYYQLYDPQKEETLAGEVVRIEQSVPMRRMSQGIVLVVKSDKETIAVHLGPSWFIERLDTKINTGDKLEIIGVRTEIGGKPALLAGEVKKGDAVLLLRDEQGVPVWAGWGRRR